MSDQPKVNIEVEINPAYMNREEMWPDDDGPDNPTAKDVVKLIEQYGGIRRAVEDWNLLNGAYVRVTVDGVTTTEEIW